MSGASLLQDIAELDAALGTRLSSHQHRQIVDFLALLSRWNRTYNLTAVRNTAAMLTQHVADCLAIVGPLRRMLRQPVVRALDVGSGGGLPGVLLSIAEPAWRITCIDAVGKKSAFIQQVAVEVGLPNLVSRHARVEDVDDAVYDLVVSRAFSDLRHLVSVTSALLAPDGWWAAMKGNVAADEIATARAVADVFHVEQLQVPGLDGARCLVWMRPRSSP